MYENENFLAFLDIHPFAHGHTLVIPKEHVVWMQEATNETISNIFILSKDLMQHMKAKLNCDYVQVSVVGKDVPHFHVHLVPRYENDTLKNNWTTFTYGVGEAEAIAKKILES